MRGRHRRFLGRWLPAGVGAGVGVRPLPPGGVPPAARSSRRATGITLVSSGRGAAGPLPVAGPDAGIRWVASPEGPDDWDP
ncbi:hypothetical protein [Nocardioides oleivorans]|uniref:hypothetical protein n=1 Tax=Nocardioides oleivorans TaxID=273676 RepID=UPI0013EBD24F|nr:hypothetical protein [Nocardioides oleivorans]